MFTFLRVKCEIANAKHERRHFDQAARDETQPHVREEAWRL